MEDKDMTQKSRRKKNKTTTTTTTKNNNIFHSLFNCLFLEVKIIPLNSENKPRGLYLSKALFEGLIFGGAYVGREIWVSKSIGLA